MCFKLSIAFAQEFALQVVIATFAFWHRCDFQTSRKVENTRQSRVIFNELRSVFKSEEIVLSSI